MENELITDNMIKERICKERFGIKPSYPDENYPKDQLLKGISVELEHIDKNLEEDESALDHFMDATGFAKCIAKNHLDEQRDSGEVMDYYDRLTEMERNFTKIK